MDEASRPRRRDGPGRDPSQLVGRQTALASPAKSHELIMKHIGEVFGRLAASHVSAYIYHRRQWLSRGTRQIREDGRELQWVGKY